MKGVSAIFAFLCLLLLFSSNVSAVICPARPEPLETFEQAKGVFVGKVIEADYEAESYTFEVEKSWKSVETDKITLKKFVLGGVHLIPGESYLVYAFDYEGISILSSCLTMKIGDDRLENDLRFLEKKPTIALKKKIFTSNFQYAVFTAIVGFWLVGVGYLLIRFFRRRTFR